MKAMPASDFRIGRVGRIGQAGPRARRGGQVLVVMLLAMAALAGLAFYVYNVGQQVNRRAEMQDAADAVAISGAAWMARSMNSVAMNNLAQSRMVALVPVLDSLPLATEMSFYELNDWFGDGAYDTTAVRKIRGLTAFVNGLNVTADGLDKEAKDKILTGVSAILERLKEQRALLAPIRDLAGPIERATNWSIRGTGGPPPHGQFWRTAVMLDDYSRSIVGSAGLLAQADAVRFGRANKADAAFLVPVAPAMPAERGSFGDFATVIKSRLKVDLRQSKAATELSSDIGGAIPYAAWPYRLGPWARFLPRPEWAGHYYYFRDNRGWRHEWGKSTWVPDGTTTTIVVPPRAGRRITGPTAGGGRAGSTASRGQGARAGQTITRPDGHTEKEVYGYTTFGPYYWAKRWITNYLNSTVGANRRRILSDTLFTDYFNKNTSAKLGYMFSGPNPTLKKIHYPLWYTDLAEARKIAEDPINKVTLSRYYYIEVIYKIVGGQKSITSDNLSDPVTKDFGGWVAPEDLRRVSFGGDPQVSEAEQIGSLPMWKFTAEGTEQRFSPEGELTDEWPVEFVWYFIFAGIDAGGEAVITNPCNWDSDDYLPAPWLLTPEGREYSVDPDFADGAGTMLSARREHFAFLGVVRKQTAAPFWPRKFSSGNPLNSIVTVAQAKVFNNRSWDLWTQDWQAQLTSVKVWDEWVDRIDYGIGSAPLTNGMVDAAELERIRDYMWTLAGPTVEDYLTH